MRLLPGRSPGTATRRDTRRAITRAPGFVVLGAVLGLVSCAATPAGSVPPDERKTIAIPEDAAAVDQIYLFRPDKWSRLNERMALVWSQSKPYLLVSDSGCPQLMQPNGSIALTNQHETALHTGTMVLVNGAPCQISRIYAVSSDDALTLQKSFHP